MSQDRATVDALFQAQREILTARPKPSANPKRQRLAGLWAKPFHSDALGVNPDQIPQAQAALRAAGVTADFDSEGRCIVTSDKQYREVAKACGMWTGRDGYAVRDGEGRPVGTGRVQGRAQQEVKRVLREIIEQGQ
jgi:hypothetical protein